MTRSRAVLFALGGTLVPALDDPGRALTAALGIGSERAPDVAHLVLRHVFASPGELAARLQRELGLTADPTPAVTAVWEAHAAEPAVDSAVAVCLGALHAAGAKVAIVANAWTPAADAARSALVPIAASVDRWHVSCDAGVAAPSAAFLTDTLAALEVAPADAVMVGADVVEDLAPALALGLGGIWLRRDVGPDGAVVVDPHAAPPPVSIPAPVVPASAVIARTLLDVRRIALTWLWGTRGVRADLTAPLPD